jgi:hypothetical protein
VSLSALSEAEFKEEVDLPVGPEPPRIQLSEFELKKKYHWMNVTT